MRSLILVSLLSAACVIIDTGEVPPPPALPPTDYDGTTTATYNFQDGDTWVLGPDPVEEAVSVVYDEASGELVIETGWCTVVAHEWYRAVRWIDADVDPARTVCRLPAGDGQVELTIDARSWVGWDDEGLQIVITGVGTWNGLTSDVIVDFEGLVSAD